MDKHARHKLTEPQAAVETYQEHERLEGKSGNKNGKVMVYDSILKWSQLQPKMFNFQSNWKEMVSMKLPQKSK